MYREGPEGSPLHTLLVEGYVDGPVDVCESDWNNKIRYHYLLLMKVMLLISTYKIC